MHCAHAIDNEYMYFHTHCKYQFLFPETALTFLTLILIIKKIGICQILCILLVHYKYFQNLLLFLLYEIKRPSICRNDKKNLKQNLFKTNSHAKNIN